VRIGRDGFGCETVVLSPEYSTIDRSVPTVAVSDAAPIYLDSSEGLGTDVYALQQPAPAVSYEETPAVAYFEDSPVAVKPRQIEETYVAAEPISEPLPAPLFVEEIVEQPILAAVSPAQQGFTQEPSEALEIEVNVPTSLEGIAPPPIVEANSIPAPAIREGALDAPVLPSTEIIESELAPIVSEAAAPPRPAFTPIPQPGLSSYGSAF